MKKTKIIDVFGTELWEAAILAERKISAKMHHPLLINLAYAFQNVDYLWLVMDICDAGDLAAFGAHGKHKLTREQLHFVGIETFCIIAHLHRQCIMYRDLKPANLLLDDGGHCRLIDFGTAKMNVAESADCPPDSAEECGSRLYMAPEVQNIEASGERYTHMCDYFSFGVMMYELAERAFPFGLHPQYTDMSEEFVQPELLDEAVRDGTRRSIVFIAPPMPVGCLFSPP